ncbi:MAG: hypothetical protein K2L18_01205 [Acetatifactor sp.]|nr:hypothetical protein [Acetatifactor sp.]
MNYIWETALAADQSGITREKITYRPARNGSPYAEVVLENLNSSTLESTEVEVNPYTVLQRNSLLGSMAT